MESGNEYVLQVKGNQPNLLNAIKQTIIQNTADDTDCVVEKNRGRQEHREVYVYSQLDNPVYADWYGIKKVIHVVSKGKRKNKEYLENRYYISSSTLQSAKIYNTGIRGHWGIENKLHWVKDVILNEDKSMVIDLARSGNMSIIRSIVINVYKMSGYHSIKYAIEEFTNRIEQCTSLISNNLVYE